MFVVALSAVATAAIADNAIIFSVVMIQVGEDNINLQTSAIKTKGTEPRAQRGG